MSCYLDHAATSWPKALGVAEAMVEALQIAGSPGRAAHAGTGQAERILQRLRTRLAQLFHAPAAANVILTSGGTESLNLGINAWLRPGDHVVTTQAEHNSVLRPLERLRANSTIDLTVIGVDRTGQLLMDELWAALRPTTRLVLMTHVSNVTGAIQPIEQVGERLRESPTALMIDACQSVGELPLSMSAIGIDLLAASGHKGLRGPAGSGFLLVSEKVSAELEPWKLGGTGSQSESLQMPTELPGRLEAGTPPLPALAGLLAAVSENQVSASSVAKRRELTGRLWEGLARIPGVERVGPNDLNQHHGPTSITLAGWDPHDAASVLDASFDVQVRAGRHCAALIHAAIDTERLGGTLRISPGQTTTVAEIDHFLYALGELIAI